MSNTETKTTTTYNWTELEDLLMFDQILDRYMDLKDTCLSYKNGNWRIVSTGTLLPSQYHIHVFDILCQTPEFLQQIQDIKFWRMSFGTLNARIKQLYALVEEAIANEHDFQRRHPKKN